MIYLTNERRQDLRAFAIGAVGYSLIELAYRRRTHWTMAVTGGLCFMLMHKICRRHRQKSRWFKCAVGAALITSVEFVVGCIVNLALKWAVWDYSACRLNLLGQICPQFSVIWFFLCLPITWLSNLLCPAKNPQKSPSEPLVPTVQSQPET